MAQVRPRLVTFGISHFCEKARWALDWHGCTFVGLQRGRPEISQAGRDPPDGFHLETRQALLPISLGSVYLRKRRRAAVPYGFVASTQNPLLVSTQTHLQHAIVWSDFEEVADPAAAISIHARHDDATQPTQDP